MPSLDLAQWHRLPGDAGAGVLFTKETNTAAFGLLDGERHEAIGGITPEDAGLAAFNVTPSGKLDIHDTAAIARYAVRVHGCLFGKLQLLAEYVPEAESSPSGLTPLVLGRLTVSRANEMDLLLVD